jgi:carboxypeptidase Taq
VGFDFQRGRVDTTLHPFMVTVGVGDSRIALRYSSSDLSVGLYALLHEVGHALYEQGLDPEHAGTPMGEAASLGIHESQSRLWENAVGRSRAFWAHFLPLAQEVFHDGLGTATVDDVLRAACRVERGLNRVQADEVTYNLHVMVRFELERALIGGELAPADLPEAWRELYREYLGVTPQNDREGCLQDSHWSSGLIGYFPTYTLGNIYGAQLFAAARRALGDLDRQLGRGEFAPLLGWLREKVHHHGMRYRAADLVRQATGAPPGHEPLVASLRARYGGG